MSTPPSSLTSPGSAATTSSGFPVSPELSPSTSLPTSPFSPTSQPFLFSKNYIVFSADIGKRLIPNIGDDHLCVIKHSSGNYTLGKLIQTGFTYECTRQDGSVYSKNTFIKIDEITREISLYACAWPVNNKLKGKQLPVTFDLKTDINTNEQLAEKIIRAFNSTLGTTISTTAMQKALE